MFLLLMYTNIYNVILFPGVNANRRREKLKKRTEENEKEIAVPVARKEVGAIPDATPTENHKDREESRT